MASAEAAFGSTAFPLGFCSELHLQEPQKHFWPERALSVQHVIAEEPYSQPEE